MPEAIRRYRAEVRRGHGLEVQIRGRLTSGEVVVRAIGNDLHMHDSAMGQTTHLAACMAQLAPPGAIRLRAEPLRLAEGWAQVPLLGPVPVKRLPAPTEVCALVGAGPHALAGPAGGVRVTRRGGHALRPRPCWRCLCMTACL